MNLKMMQKYKSNVPKLERPINKFACVSEKRPTSKRYERTNEQKVKKRKDERTNKPTTQMRIENCWDDELDEPLTTGVLDAFELSLNCCSQ